MVTPQSSPRQQAVLAARQVLQQQPVYIDTETTGLDKNAEIIEITIVDHDGSVLYESLVRPSQPIPQDAMRIHHITNEMVAHAPTWPVVWPTVRGFLTGRIIAIYNEDYDVRLMQQTHARYRLPWRESLKTFCIMKNYAQYRGEYDPRRRSYRYFSLEDAGRLANISIPNSHRATDDTLLARALLLHIAGVTIQS